jgi:hypothetical protein
MLVSGLIVGKYMTIKWEKRQDYKYQSYVHHSSHLQRSQFHSDNTSKTTQTIDTRAILMDCH